MSSERIPVHYEYDEAAAAAVVQLLKDDGVKATVDSRRGSYAILVPTTQAEKAIARLGDRGEESDASQSRMRRLAPKAVALLVGVLVVGLLARSVWGIAALWFVLVIGGGLSWAFYTSDSGQPRYRGD